MWLTNINHAVNKPIWVHVITTIVSCAFLEIQKTTNDKVNNNKDIPLK